MPTAIALSLDFLQNHALPQPNDVEASMLRGAATTVIEEAMAGGNAQADFHGYHLDARRQQAMHGTQVRLQISHDGDVVSVEDIVVRTGWRDAARRD